MTEPTPVQTTDVAAAPSRLVPTVVLALLSAVLTWQILGEPLAALGAALFAAAFTAATWTRLVVRSGGHSLGGAALCGVIALAAAFVGAGIVGVASSTRTVNGETGVALLFALWIVAPVFVAVAVALAAFQRRAVSRAE